MEGLTALRPHGTLAAYKRHQRRKEKHCRKCKDCYNKWRLKRKMGDYKVSPECRVLHNPVLVRNRKKKYFWECGSCGAWICWRTLALFTRQDVIKVLKERNGKR